MKLYPLDTPELLELVAGWLARKENHQWLDFGNGRQIITPALLKTFKTAMFWGAVGEKSFRNRGYSTVAGSKFLTLGFRDLGLHAINTWAVGHNQSLRIIERLGFRFIGRQRQCHYIDGRPYDRLMFDLLASEHRELGDERRHWAERSHRQADCEAQPG